VSDRHAGLMVPLSAAASRRSWGLGEIPDLIPLSAWLASAGFTRVMILPIGTIADLETSPYSAMSAMAIDPTYIALDDVPDFAAAGGVGALSEEAQRDLAAVRAETRVRYARIRRIKQDVLALAFDRFLDEEWNHLTTRAAELAAYVARERSWLDDYALYAALCRAIGSRNWRQWPAPLRRREPHAIAQVRRELWRDILRQQYLQWVAERQWDLARAAAAAHGITVFGDLPFMVSADSPDVWVHQDEFRFDVSLGVPPDDFSDEGQDWKLPTYHWERIATTDYAWIRQRARRMAHLYGGLRIDHLVGFYRTFGRPADGATPFFTPPDEPTQIHQGETILRIFQGTGAAIVAEDLGLVPDFVRASLARLGVPGSKVLRWEREYRAPGEPFIDPRAYPAVSAALSGTHDTSTLAEWWDESDEAERHAFLVLLRAHAHVNPDLSQPWTESLRDATLQRLYESGSRETFIMMQDAFGWRDRINVPGTISETNWTWRLPWPVDVLHELPAATERAAFLRHASLRSSRFAGGTPASPVTE
jgi:4-alpha-glucanotransferase